MAVTDCHQSGQRDIVAHNLERSGPGVLNGRPRIFHDASDELIVKIETPSAQLEQRTAFVPRDVGRQDAGRCLSGSLTNLPPVYNLDPGSTACQLVGHGTSDHTSPNNDDMRCLLHAGTPNQ